MILLGETIGAQEQLDVEFAAIVDELDMAVPAEVKEAAVFTAAARRDGNEVGRGWS
jgi:hypothetical protein